MMGSASATPRRRKTDFGRLVRDALIHLHDYVCLQTHPLASALLPPSEARSARAGRRLHERLVAAIEALRPEAEAAAAAPAGRIYHLLRLRYVEGRAIAEVCARLGIGESQYHRAHALGLEALISLLAGGGGPGDVEGPRAPDDPPLPSGPPVGARAARPGLPRPLTSFVGRRRELARIQELLGEARLLTLIGPPGVGKTRLAIEVAHRRAEAPSGSVYFVPLAAVPDPALVAPALAEALGLPDSGDPPLRERLRRALAGQAALLVLDNVEHLLEGAGIVVELLASCPHLRVLTTSRAALRVSGEQEFPVPPLTVPLRDRLARATPVDLLGLLDTSDAIRLFVERSRLVQPDFALTEENAIAVAEICRRLDGLPLAIELAAPRIRLLPPAAMLTRFERRLPLLTDGPRDAPARQQTLRGAIAWSYDLLGDEEQALFRRLAVFAGGFTLPAAEMIAEATIEALTSLLDKSLLYRLGGGPFADDAEPRFGMLETIREYGLERLAAHGELASIAGRHLGYFLARAEEAEPELTGPRMDGWVERLETDHDNFRAALRWAIEAGGDEALGPRLAGALWRFWEIRAHFAEGRRWLELALARCRRVAPAARAKALVALCNAAADQGDLAAARSTGEEGLALYRHLDDPEGMEWALVSLGDVAMKQGNRAAAGLLYEEAEPLARERGNRVEIAYLLGQRGEIARQQGELALARSLCAESLALRREVGDTWSIALSLNKLARVITDQGDLALARALLEEALAISRGMKDRRSIAWVLDGLGDVAREEGDFGGARALYEESLIDLREVGVRWELTRVLGSAGEEGLAVARKQGYPDGVAAALAGLGLLAIEVGDLAAARARLDESLRLYEGIGDPLKVVEALEAQATLAAAEGLPARAAILRGAAAAWRAAHGAPIVPEARRHESELVAARGEPDLASARNVGRRMELAEAVRYARSDESIRGLGRIAAECPGGEDEA